MQTQIGPVYFRDFCNILGNNSEISWLKQGSPDTRSAMLWDTPSSQNSPATNHVTVFNFGQLSRASFCDLRVWEHSRPHTNSRRLAFQSWHVADSHLSPFDHGSFTMWSCWSRGGAGHSATAWICRFIMDGLDIGRPIFQNLWFETLGYLHVANVFCQAAQIQRDQFQ